MKTIRVRFDGRVLIPEEPLDLPHGQVIAMHFEPPSLRPDEQSSPSMHREDESKPASVPSYLTMEQDQIL